MKLGLGTAQFGMDYGIANKIGRTALAEAQAMIELAENSGMTVIDTAVQYGDSEALLGWLLPKQHAFRITTKLPGLVPPEGKAFDPDEAVRLLNASLTRLQQPALYGTVLHRAQDLLSPYGDEIMKGLQKCKRLGLTSVIGVSVYAEDQLEELINCYPIELIQVPVSLFDQRLIHNGFLKRCKAQGIEVHARSVFLQGLLCMDPQALPYYFQPYREQLQAFHNRAAERGLSPMDAALHFVNEIEEVDSIICGVNDSGQLRQLLSSLRRPVHGVSDAHFAGRFAMADSALLNPSQWQIS